jgi:hypothetical protein
MMKEEKDTKALKPKDNKVLTPDENKADETIMVVPPAKMVWIRVNHNRAIAGLGTAGEEFEVSELVAKNFVAQGLATIIEKEK